MLGTQHKLLPIVKLQYYIKSVNLLLIINNIKYIQLS